MNILFLCTGNSCRSILAEATFNHLAPAGMQALSAGSHPAGSLHPRAVALLHDQGIPTAGCHSKSWNDLPHTPDIVITVCDSAAGETCPAYLGPALRAHWGVDDPGHVAGTDAQIQAAFANTYRILRARIVALLALPLQELGNDRARLKSELDRIGASAHLPNIELAQLDLPTMDKLAQVGDTSHPSRILMLYGSLRERSFSRLLTEEAARILAHYGAEVRIFNPLELPMAGSVPDDHPKVVELRELCLWSEGQVWCSPERHGTITAVMKNQIDWIPLEMGAIRPSQGRTLAVMQVCGGSQSFNVVNTMRLLGRWMRMFTIPNQSSVPMAYKEFDDAGRMRPSGYYDRVVDVMEELFKMTLLLRGRSDYLTSRYSERNERAMAAIDRAIEKI
jgi:arsenic resistance protein ArsH